MERVREDEDTQPQLMTCSRCRARASVDEAIVRSGAERVTIVATYSRPGLARCAVERTKALICLPGGVITHGEGHSREEAIENALHAAGVKV